MPISIIILIYDIFAGLSNDVEALCSDFVTILTIFPCPDYYTFCLSNLLNQFELLKYIHEQVNYFSTHKLNLKYPP